MTAASYQCLAATIGFFNPKLFFDFLTKDLDVLVAPIPYLQLSNLAIGSFAHSAVVISAMPPVRRPTSTLRVNPLRGRARQLSPTHTANSGSDLIELALSGIVIRFDPNNLQLSTTMLFCNNFTIHLDIASTGDPDIIDLTTDDESASVAGANEEPATDRANEDLAGVHCNSSCNASLEKGYIFKRCGCSADYLSHLRGNQELLKSLSDAMLGTSQTILSSSP
ncbi:hypothetical protein S40288_11499 [Stachybotrys chartarum IBT 40288]|nr:hypothetical protein S40288_11499 [Stachybotrys chartarum IBT 40288]